MLTWAAIFFVLSLIAGFLGFRGAASTGMQIAKVLFFIFIILFIISLLVSFFGMAATATVA